MGLDNVVGGIDFCTVEGYGNLSVSSSARCSVNKDTKTVARGMTGELEVSVAPRTQFIEVDVTDRAGFDLEGMVNDLTGLTVTIGSRNGVRRTLSNAIVSDDSDLDLIAGKGTLMFVGAPLVVRRP